MVQAHPVLLGKHEWDRGECIGETRPTSNRLKYHMDKMSLGKVDKNLRLKRVIKMTRVYIGKKQCKVKHTTREQNLDKYQHDLQFNTKS